MLRLRSAVSGEVIVALDARELEGKSVKDLKKQVARQIGASRFRQRWFNDHQELQDEVLDLPSDVQLVVLDFMPFKNQQEETELIDLCRQNQIDKVEALLLRPLDPKTTDNLGRSACHCAAMLDHEECLSLVIEAGAEIDAEDNQGLTPLQIAIEMNLVEAVRVLLHARADVNKASDSSKAIPRMGLMECVGVMFRARRNNPNSPTAMDHARNLDTSYAPTALHLAVERGHLNVVRLLLENKADINEVTKNGASSLYLALDNGRKSVAKLLLESRADAKKATDSGSCALHLASKRGDLEMVRLLLAAGVDKDQSSKLGITALYLAAAQGHLEVVACLLVFPVNINVITRSGMTALHAAAEGGHVEVVQFLLKAAIDPNKASNEGASALHLAAAGGHLQLVSLLLEAGCEKNQLMKGELTALDLARQRGRFDVTRFLLQGEAQAKDALGRPIEQAHEDLES